jgi:carboxyl-terminal processing protease
MLAEAEKQKIKPVDDAELQRTLPRLKSQLKALVARDLWDMSEYFAIINEDSDIVNKAISLLGNKE